MDFKSISSLLLLLLLGSCQAQPGNDHDANNTEAATKDIISSILNINKGVPVFLLEGDVLITNTRTAMKCFGEPYSCLWPKSPYGHVDIPFILSEKYDDTEKKEIMDAMRDMAAKTCIRFIPRGSEIAYLSIEPRFGCSSLLGYSGARQVVSLQRFGCIKKGIIMHELLHALGFYHEHTRSDRDMYIRINWDNIIQHFVYNFRKMDTNNLNTPYDYQSVMHYGRTAFGYNAKETITPTLDPTAPIGQRDNMSDIDVYRVNKLYQCHKHLRED